MEQNVIQRNMWNTAGKAGLVLGAVSAIYVLLIQGLTMIHTPAILMILLMMILWASKFGGCIFLMILYMKRFATDNPGTDRRDVYKTGRATALLSALVYAAFSFANIAYFYPEFFAGQMDAIMEQIAPMLDSNTLSAMEKTMQDLPQTTFFSNLIYCFFYGTVLSHIIARLMPMQDSSSDFKTEEQ